jgi:hypothetical protein
MGGLDMGFFHVIELNIMGGVDKAVSCHWTQTMGGHDMGVSCD